MHLILCLRGTCREIYGERNLRDEADAEAQVAAMVAALFLVNRGYASIRQEDGMDGKVILRDLHPEERTSTFFRSGFIPKRNWWAIEMDK